ncbi:MAG: PH domain-containing protein [Actinobacteria bacterium]|nr:PH domain-containing protein [Actinomycetota bacterium]
MHRQTFQSQSQVVAAAGVAVVTLFIGVGGLLSGSSLAGKVAVVAGCGIVIVGALRVGQAKLISTPTGVEVSNPFSHYSVAWSEIEKFELGRWKINPALCLIRLRDGGIKPVHGIFENNSGFGGGPKLVTELNEELRRLRPRGSA